MLLVGSWLVLHGLFAKFWTNDIVDDKLLENHHETTDNPVKCDTAGEKREKTTIMSGLM